MARVRDTRNMPRGGCATEDLPWAEVKVGDWVDFKSDIEQSGQIIEITPSRYRGAQLKLRNESGFGGDYLRYATVTVVSADDCWI